MPVILEAGGGVPAYLSLTAVLVVSAAISGIFSVQLKVVPIVGFLLAGVLIGPAQLGLVTDTEAVDAAAELGVILLLFTIGIEFSLQRLAAVWKWIVVGGGLQVLLATAAGAGLVSALGGDIRTGIFTGFLIALSSTAIVLKVNADARESNSRRGRLVLAVLIFQDLAVVAMVLLVPALGEGGDGGAGELFGALGIAAAVIAGVLVVARKLMPPLLERIAALCSPEAFLLAVIGICLGTAYLTSLAGVSVSLGAFLAGLVVSESRQSTQALTEVLPLQIIFSAVFFISVGMLLNVSFLVDNIITVLSAVLLVLIIKVVTTTLALMSLRVGFPMAVSGGLLLGQVGEFSFVLVTAGAAVGLTPGGLGDEGSQIFVATTVVLMLLTPFLAAAGRRIARPRSQTENDVESSPSSGVRRENHVVIVGWGGMSVRLGQDLQARRVPVTMTTLNPGGSREAEAAGIDVVSGDGLHSQVLLDAGIRDARAVIVAEDTVENEAKAVAAARSLTDAPIFVRPLDGSDVATLSDAGADHVVDPDASVERALLASLLTQLDLPGPHVQESTVDTTKVFDVDVDVFDDNGCSHSSTSMPVLPRTAGCEECEISGQHWVHLRVCLTCGHVGCCDSSPNRHSRVHFQQHTHPVIASSERGESWAYCFVDDVTMDY